MLGSIEIRGIGFIYSKRFFLVSGASNGLEAGTNEKRAQGPHVLDEEISPVLLFARQIVLGLDSDQKPPLKVHQLVQVEEQVVDEILGDDFLALEASHVVLQGLQVLHVFTLRVNQLPYDPGLAVHGLLLGRLRTQVRIASDQQQIALLQDIQDSGDCLGYLATENMEKAVSVRNSPQPSDENRWAR